MSGFWGVLSWVQPMMHPALISDLYGWLSCFSFLAHLSKSGPPSHSLMLFVTIPYIMRVLAITVVRVSLGVVSGVLFVCVLSVWFVVRLFLCFGGLAYTVCWLVASVLTFSHMGVPILCGVFVLLLSSWTRLPGLDPA